MQGSITESEDFDWPVFRAKVGPALEVMEHKHMVLRQGECLMWTGVLNENDYPKGMEGGTVHGQLVRKLGIKVPRNRVVRHLCGHRLCIRPSHLGLGSNGENMMDRAKHGKTVMGEKNGNSKLSDIQRGEIRQRRKSGESFRSIAAYYPVCYTQIMRICQAVNG